MPCGHTEGQNNNKKLIDKRLNNPKKYFKMAIQLIKINLHNLK